MSREEREYEDYFKDAIEAENKERKGLYKLFAETHNRDGQDGAVAETFGAMRIRALKPGQEYLSKSGWVVTK